MPKLPFRQTELLSVSDFVRYCADHAIHTDKQQLEVLHKQALLVPVVRLYIGVNEFRNIYANFDGATEWRFVNPKDVKKFKPQRVAKEKYYHVGGIFRRGNDWLDLYIKRRMVKYPNTEKYKAWPKPTFYDFTTKLKTIEQAQELFYEKYQMLWLKQIIRVRKYHALTPSPSETLRTNRLLKVEAKKFYAFMQFYIEAETFYERAETIKSDNWQKNLDEYKGDRAEAKREWNAHFAKEYIPAFEAKAKSLLAKHKLSVEQVKDWQRLLARKTLLGESRFGSKASSGYLKGMNDALLVKAEDTNYMIYVLNQIIDLATGEHLTVRQVLGDAEGFRCSYCHQLFRSTKRQRYSCGKPECVQAHKNELKRKKRKIGIYKPR